MLKKLRYGFILLLVSSILIFYLFNYKLNRHNSSNNIQTVLFIPTGKRDQIAGKQLWQDVGKNKMSDLLFIHTRAWLETRQDIQDAPYILLTLIYELSLWEKEKESPSSVVNHIGYIKMNSLFYALPGKWADRCYLSRQSVISNVTYKRQVILFQLPESDTYTDLEKDFVYVYDDTDVNVQPNVIEIQFPDKTAYIGGVSICVPPLYGQFTTPKERFLIEWIEMNRILGVKRINLYNKNITLSATVEKAIEIYKMEGLVSMEQFDSPFYTDLMSDAENDRIHKIINTVGLSDCFFKNMYIYDYVLVIDIDEVVFPYLHNTYTGLLNHLFVNESDHYSQYTTINLRRATLVNPDTDVLSKIFSSHHYYPETGHLQNLGKSFMSSKYCPLVGSHRCDMSNINYERVISISDSLVMVHHYRDVCKRSCNRASYMPVSNIGRFRYELYRALEEIYQKLNVIQN